MSKVFHLKYKLELKNEVSGSMDSPVSMLFNIGGPEPDVLGEKILTVAENGSILFYDQVEHVAFSNKKLSLSEDGKSIIFED